jgi:hypothetical protein
VLTKPFAWLLHFRSTLMLSGYTGSGQQLSHYGALLLDDALALLLLVDSIGYELPEQGLVADAFDGGQHFDLVIPYHLRILPLTHVAAKGLQVQDAPDEGSGGRSVPDGRSP